MPIDNQDFSFMVNGASHCRKLEVFRAIRAATLLPDAVSSIIVDHVVGSELDAAVKIVKQYWNIRERSGLLCRRMVGGIGLKDKRYMKEAKHIHETLVSWQQPQKITVYDFMLDAAYLSSFWKRRGLTLIIFRKRFRKAIGEYWAEHPTAPQIFPEEVQDLSTIDFN